MSWNGDDQDLLPASATPYMRAMSKTSARMLDAPTQVVRSERDPLQCDDAFVPLLAWERSIHHWVPGDDAGNRAKIASSFTDHTSYGTPQALEGEIAQDTGQTIQIREWWQEKDLRFPYFVVQSVIDPGDQGPDLDAVTASALTRKNVRDMPHARVFVNQPPAPIFVGASTSFSITSRMVTPPQPPAPFVGATSRFLMTNRVAPQ